MNNHDTLEFPVDELITYPLRKYILKRKIDCLVMISKGLEKIAETRWGIPWEKLITIYNPIVGEEIFENYPEPEEYKAFPGVPKIVAVSRLDLDTKDFPTLLRAFALFKKRYERAKLFIIGDGPDKEKIQKFASELGLEDSVELLGFRANPYPYIKYADVLVHFSLVEALGRTIVEAMALGCPVVATDCPVGPRELIDNNENGILVPMKNPEKMAEAMIRIIEDKELRGRLVKNGEKIAQRFSALTAVRKREELFRDLVKHSALI